MRPFKSKFKNTQESFVPLNLLLVYLFALHDRYNNTRTAVAHFLTLVVLSYFILFIMYACITTMCLSKNWILREFVIRQIMTHKKNKVITPAERYNI